MVGGAVVRSVALYRGLIHRLMGNDAKARAGAQADRALELFPLERDHVWGPSLQMDVAMIHAMLGDVDAAMVYAERSLSWPDYYTAQRVRLDPWLKALADHPGFEEMARRAAERRAAHFEPAG